MLHSIPFVQFIAIIRGAHPFGVTEISFLRTGAGTAFVTLRDHRGAVTLSTADSQSVSADISKAGLRTAYESAVNQTPPRPVPSTGCKGDGSFPNRISGHTCE